MTEDDLQESNELKHGIPILNERRNNMIELTKEEAINNIINILSNIKNTDNGIIKSIHSLKIVLLNLKIESARIRENTGIIPIAERLERDISDIEDHLSGLIRENESLFLKSLDALKD